MVHRVPVAPLEPPVDEFMPPPLLDAPMPPAPVDDDPTLPLPVDDEPPAPPLLVDEAPVEEDELVADPPDEAVALPDPLDPVPVAAVAAIPPREQPARMPTVVAMAQSGAAIAPPVVGGRLICMFIRSVPFLSAASRTRSGGSSRT